MKVPQMKPFIGEEEAAAVADVVRSGWITEGPKSEEFKEEILNVTGARYVVLAPNGTLALYLALKACDIGPGDEVIVPDTTFIASATSVQMAGATPLFIDIDLNTLQIDTKRVWELTCPGFMGGNVKRFVMPVHLFGNSADMQAIMKVTPFAIEDACQGFGTFCQTEIGRQGCGTMGMAGAVSFFADKVVTAGGEGGCVLTNDEVVYRRLLYLRNQGRLERGSFIHPEIGYNFRMTDIQSAMGLIQLKKLPEIRAKRTATAKLYAEGLQRLVDEDLVRILKPSPCTLDPIPFRVVIFTDRAHELMKFMRLHNVEPRSMFYPLHRQPCFLDNKVGANDHIFPNAIKAYETGICLPTYTNITSDEVGYVCATIQKFFLR